MPFLLDPNFPENFSYDVSDVSQTVLVPEGQQMRVYNTLDLANGDLQSNGITLILDT
jgi:hypothetical protein